MVVHAWNALTLEAEAEELGVQGQPWVFTQVKASLGYLSLCLEQKIQTNTHDLKLDNYNNIVS